MTISTIEYDTEFINNVLEKIKQSVIKIKNFIRHQDSKFKFYHDLDSEFDEIADSLEKYDVLDNEFLEFLGIKRKVLNIVYNNCRDSSFGHCDFAIKLLEKYNELLAAKINLLSDFTSKRQEKYELFYNEYRVAMKKLDFDFHLNIFKPKNDKYSPENVYEVMKECKWCKF